MVNIDIKSTTVEKGIDAANAFLQKLIGPPIEELGLLQGDIIRLWRLKRQINVLKNAEEYAKLKNINPKHISLKVLVPLLDGASLEEDETLQEKWTALLVNYTDPKKNLKSTVFPSLLKEISATEAKVLESIPHDRAIIRESLIENFSISEAEIFNLVRLGLIKENLKLNDMGLVFAGPNNIITSSGYLITNLGIEFLKACTLD